MAAKAKKDLNIADRPVLHQEISAQMAIGEDAISVQLAKDLLGWTDDANAAKLAGADSHHLLDRDGKKVWLLNNVNNRPIYPQVYEGLVQEHLMKRWRFNGEPIIIGKTGLVL